LSGIGAVFHKNGRPVLRDELNRLAGGLRPFGRAYQTIACLGPCGLAYAHAPNSPQSATDRQPVTSLSRALSLVFDGRLDNREELCGTLGISHADAVAWPDSRIALESWEKWGEHAPKYWVGEFAVLVWNAPTKTLTAVRDQLANRVVSYHETPERIVIASSPRAIFAIGDIVKEIDEQKLADSLVQLYDDGARSFYKGISRLRPAHRLIVTSNRTGIERYWSLDDVPEIKLASDDQYVEAAAELLGRATKACLRRAGPVGAFMSGGLDSSTVAVTALSHLKDQEKLPTFTWVPVKNWDGRCPPGNYGDETPYVKAIANAHPRIDPVFVRSEGHGLFHQLDDFLDYAGVAPRNAINLFWFHDIHMEAESRGLKVLLEGGAGNMSLSWEGRGILLEHLKNRDGRMLVQELFAAKFDVRVFLNRFIKMLLLPLAPDAVNTAWLRARGHINSLPLWHKSSAINPDFAKAMNIDKRLKSYGFSYFMKPEPDSRKFRQLMLNDGTSNEKADIQQAFRALYGIEMRDPLGNRRLVEWCLGLPESQFQRMGRARWLIKRVMKDKLPPEVLYKRDDGKQASDWHYRMTQDLPKIREELEAIVDDPDTSRYIDTKRIKAFLDNWPSKTPLKPMPGHTYSYIPVSIGAALAAGRFVRRTKGANR
jgi:asparagine synthase (glutamine-hydrolysing)